IRRSAAVRQVGNLPHGNLPTGSSNHLPILPIHEESFLYHRRYLCVAALLFCLPVTMGVTLGDGLAARPPDHRTAISLHPANPKYFLFRNRPLVLVTATEHYGSVINRAFDSEKYLNDAADKKMTLTRTFLLFRELQTPRNPSSPCKPESPDFITP